MKVAEPGTVISPPSAPSPSPSSSTRKEKEKEKETAGDVDAETKSQSADESDGSGTGLSAEPEFHPSQCLFCGADNDSFDENIAHMARAHSFTIPYQDQLTVDLETLVGYLHLVIYGYGECILCAAHRNTVEGIQHHMMAKGHCRFDVSSDIAEFYEMNEPEFQADQESLRLPSGKLLSHRTRVTGPAAWKAARQSAERRLEASTSTALATRSQESELVQMQEDAPAAPPSTQLSRMTLTQGDQQSLAHLPDHEVRSLLATSARHIDQSRREEQQSQLKLEQAGNTTLTGHFRMDTSKRFRGPWG